MIDLTMLTPMGKCHYLQYRGDKVTEQEKTKIASLWKDGMPLEQIRQLFGVSRTEFNKEVKEMKKQKIFPNERIKLEDRVVQEYLLGERNPYNIAKNLNTTIGTVRVYLCKNNLKLGKKTKHYICCEKTNEIKSAIEEGSLSSSEIAKIFGVSRQYVNELKIKSVNQKEVTNVGNDEHF